MGWYISCSSKEILPFLWKEGHYCLHTCHEIAMIWRALLPSNMVDGYKCCRGI
jgi:hypothetical protein